MCSHRRRRATLFSALSAFQCRGRSRGDAAHLTVEPFVVYLAALATAETELADDDVDPIGRRVEIVCAVTEPALLALPFLGDLVQLVLMDAGLVVVHVWIPPGDAET